MKLGSIVFLFTACCCGFAGLSAQPMPERFAASTLLELPTPAHEREVLVFFAGEPMPARDYLHLGYLSARRTGHDNLTALVVDLKKQAQRLGADGIIVWQPELKTEAIYTDEWVGHREVTDITAVAILFPESLQFIPGLVKAWHIYGIDSTGSNWKLHASQPYDFKGAPGPLQGSKTWFDWWHKKTHYYLMEGPGRTRLDIYQRIESRLIHPERMRVRPRYEIALSNHIQLLRLSVRGTALATIKYQYEEDKKTIKSREIAMRDKPGIAFLEYPEHDEEGQIRGYLYLTRDSAGKTEQFMRASVEYYTEEEWDAAVQGTLAQKLAE